jgi:hypothetical protein
MDAEWVWGCMREDFPASTMTACLGLLRKTHPDLATHVSHVAQSTSRIQIMKEGLLLPSQDRLAFYYFI